MAKKTPVESKLRKLQATVRQGEQPDSGLAYSAVVPEDLAGTKGGTLSLTNLERQRMMDAISALQHDVRFEHLFKRGPFQRIDSRRADNAVWRFICVAVLRGAENHVPAFMADHGREPRSSHCYFPVSNLTVAERFDIAGATFLPPTDTEVPDGRLLRFPPEGTTAVVSAQATGTQPGFMVERARAQVEHAVRLLRVGLRRHRVIAPEQLRFRVGHVYALSGGGAGWGRPDDVAAEVALDPELRGLFSEQPISRLPHLPNNDIQARALLALGWFDRARLTGEWLIATLYNFFGLEALFGDRSEGLKGPLISFRRAILARETVGHFRHPDHIGWLYDEIRSAAVHGEEPPEISREDHTKFNWDAWEALNQFLQFSRERGVESRSQLLLILDQSAHVRELLEALRQGNSQWDDFIPPGLRE